MGIADYDKYSAAKTTFATRFEDYFDNGVPGQWSEIADQWDMDLGETVEANWIVDLSKTRDWKGSKEFDGGRAYELTFENTKIHRSMSISHSKIRRDKTGAIGRLINRFFERGADKLYDDRVIEYLDTNPLGYDGIALTSASHQDGTAATQSNLANSSLSTAYAAVFTHQPLHENGELWDFSPTELWVSKSLEKQALELTGASRPTNVKSDGTYDQGASVVGMAMRENVYAGRMTVRVLDKLTAGNFLFVDTRGAARPIIVGLDEEVRAVSMAELDDYGRFMKDEAYFSLEGQIGLAAGPWQCCYGYIA